MKANTKESQNMKVLYLCARKDLLSTEYPAPTRWLNKFFLDAKTKEMTDRLISTFEYAVNNWDSIGDDWTGLFSDEATDRQVCSTLEAFSEAKSASNAEDANAASSKHRHTQADLRMLVLVIDDANDLLGQATDSQEIVLLRLRDALTEADAKIQSKYSWKSRWGVFGVLVGSNPRICGFLMQSDNVVLNPGYQDMDSSFFQLMDPFVLASTKSIQVQVPAAAQARRAMYQDMVINATKMEQRDKTWENLVNWGRPLWRSIAVQHQSGQLRLKKGAKQKVVTLAATKLLGGVYPGDSKAITKQSMFGVASMLCRLGLRPRVWTDLATKVVDFMAFLVYVSDDRKSVMSSYSEDPILALGATRLWYASPECLAKHILPQFKRLLSRELVDAGESEEVVACIILLLAMDECSNIRSDPEQDDYGAFQSVSKLMKVLRGPDVTCEVKDVESVKQAMDTKWDDWFVGFSHFVQMPIQPNEPSLWGLWTDRAAGIFPREDRDGADIFIPIFTPGHGTNARVSVILVELNGEVFEPEYPPYVPPFVEQLSDDVIRIQINFEDVHKPGRSFITDDSRRRMQFRWTTRTCCA